MLLAAPFLVALRAPTQTLIYIGLAGFGLFRGLYEANMWAALFEVIPKRFRGQVTAPLISVAYAVAAGAPLLLGYAKSWARWRCFGAAGESFTLYLLELAC